MTRLLLLLAIIATVLDGIAYLLLIANGRVLEMNPVFATASVWLALAAKTALVVLLIALVSVIGSTARWPLVVAVVAGMVGFVSTVMAAG